MAPWAGLTGYRNRKAVEGLLQNALPKSTQVSTTKLLAARNLPQPFASVGRIGRVRPRKT